MDQSTREVFCNLTWPSPEEVLNSSNTPPRRPSPYWLKEKLNSSRLKIHDGNSSSMNISVSRRWKQITQFADLRIILNIEPYNYERSTLFLQCKHNKFLDLKEFDFGNFLVESVSNGLLFEGEDCKITSVLTVMHPSEVSLSELTAEVSRNFPGYDVIASQTAAEDRRMKSESNYRHIFLPDGRIKPAHASVLSELVQDPLEHLNAIASNSHLKRSVARKAYIDLVRGGMIHLWPFIRSEDHRDFIVARIHFRTPRGSSTDVRTAIMKNSYVRDNYLQIWQFNRRTTICLLSVPNVEALIHIAKELSNDLGDVYLITQIKHFGYYFKDASMALIRRYSAIGNHNNLSVVSPDQLLAES